MVFVSGIGLLGVGCPETDPPKLSDLCTSASECSDGEVCWAGVCQEAPEHEGPPEVTIPDAGTKETVAVLDSGAGEIIETMDAGSGSENPVADAGVSVTEADAGSQGLNFDAGSNLEYEGVDAGIQEFECTVNSDCFGYIPCQNDPECFSPVRCDYATNICILNSCLDDFDCAEGYLCVDDQCMYAGCRDDFDCVVGFETCDQDSRECIPVQASGCVLDTDCNVLTEHCNLADGFCHAGRRCAWDANCGEASWCGFGGYCEPLRECGSNIDCDTNFCLPAESSSSFGYCRVQSVFCANDTHCSEGQKCDIFSGRCVVNVNCGQDDAVCGSQPGYACNPVGNSGQGACIYAGTPCNTSLNCASYEECRYVSPGKDAGGPKRCVPRYSCLIDPSICTPSEMCSADGICVPEAVDEACLTDGDCVDNGYENFYCAKETNDGTNGGTCREIAGAGQCTEPSDCLVGELCVFETGECIEDESLVDPTDCSDDPAICSTPSGCPQNGGACVCNTETGLCEDLAGQGECSQASDCSNDEICDLETRTCKALAEITMGECASDVDCEAGYVCDLEMENGTCLLLASTGCSDNADCGGNEECDTGSVPTRCIPAQTTSCDEDQDCEDVVGNSLCNMETEQCVLAAGGLCCTTNNAADALKCRGDEVCATNTEEDAQDNCLHVCVPLNINGCNSNADCGCGDCGQQEVCDTTQDGPGDFAGICVRVAGSDEGGCMVSDDCRFGEVCVVNDDGALVCVDEGTTIDCTTDFSVCAEGNEACLNVCVGDECNWECVLVQGGSGCGSSDDCRAGEACVLPDGLSACPDNEDCGECVNLYDCENDDDCGPGAACNLEVNSCELLGSTCSGDSEESECGSNEICDTDEGICQVLGGPCGIDADCPGESGFCDLSTGTCGQGSGCVANEDCSDYLSFDFGDLCDFALNECRPRRPECYIDAHCTGGQVCCLDGEGCVFNKCYFSTPYCGDEEYLPDVGGAAACDELGFGCNPLTQHCAECANTDQCADQICQTDIGMCGDFGF